MPIDRIPILAEDYPLFDWNDHLQSYYALGEGELVAGFQKETWNAIIDKTMDALSAAGMRWDNKYTSSTVAKVREAYGPLSAKMFNSVRHNIDLPAPVGWGWANNPNLRGYVGREDFKGYAEEGLNGDFFYAEYLLELVRRLNLMLSIMKGTANLKEMVGPILSQTDSIRNLLALPSAPMKFSQPAFSSFVCGLQANQSKGLAYADRSLTRNIATAHGFRSRSLHLDEIVNSKQLSQMGMPAVRVLPSYSEGIFSVSEAMMDVFNAIYLSSGFGLAHTTSKTTIAMAQPKVMELEVNSRASSAAPAVILQPKPLFGAESARASETATMNAPTVVATDGSEHSKSGIVTVFERIRPRRLATQTMSEVKCIAILDSAWLAPIWRNGKLYIRQAYETNQTDATLEVK